jgi:hypothetical protein
VREKRLLRRIYGSQREEGREGRIKLHNEKLRNLNFSPKITSVIESRIRLVGHVAGIGKMRYIFRILITKPEF